MTRSAGSGSGADVVVYAGMPGNHSPAGPLDMQFDAESELKDKASRRMVECYA